MGVTNYEHTINTIVHIINEREAGYVCLRRVNTGSNVYTIRISYNPLVGLTYEVEKHKSNKMYVGIVTIDRVSEYGCEYNNTIIGSLPDSVVKLIRKSFRDIIIKTK